jgi:hypothetical protein
MSCPDDGAACCTWDNPRLGPSILTGYIAAIAISGFVCGWGAEKGVG